MLNIPESNISKSKLKKLLLFDYGMIKQLEPTSNQTVFPYTRSNANKKLESCWHGLKPKNALIKRTNFQSKKAGAKLIKDFLFCHWLRNNRCAYSSNLSRDSQHINKKISGLYPYGYTHVNLQLKSLEI